MPDLRLKINIMFWISILFGTIWMFVYKRNKFENISYLNLIIKKILRCSKYWEPWFCVPTSLEPSKINIFLLAWNWYTWTGAEIFSVRVHLGLRALTTRKLSHLVTINFANMTGYIILSIFWLFSINSKTIKPNFSMK